MIRPALIGEDQGKLAPDARADMPWAGAAEVFEEIGVTVDPAAVRVVAVETTPAVP
jgi:hypothetical protein